MNSKDKITAQEMYIELKEEFYHEGTLIVLELFNADGSFSNGEL
ncbi:8328_t:CDS:2 [Cetraspora pellucida]|uniref:8328_t:CDS:1 n=1 Tax=Cetraspora pellucida TaxID=1433469 RepID=A0A9N9FSX6_9GLOM|nr:8328_t:CDS:2 [Cetraspora pellucida]